MNKGHQIPIAKNFAQLNSPRQGQGQNKKPDYNSQASKQYSSNSQFNIFKMQANKVKQREEANANHQQAKNKKNSKADHDQQTIRRNLSQSEINPYGSYFLQQKSQLQQKKSPNNQALRSTSRKTSISRDDSSQAHSNKNSYQQTLRKYANQTIRLKHQLKISLQKNDKYLMDRKNLIDQNNNLKLQIEKLHKTNQQISRKQSIMVEEIKNIKKMLIISSQQLNSSNYQMFKAKQEITELKIINQKLQQKIKQKAKQKVDKKKPVTIKSQKILQLQTESEAAINKSQPCKKCKSLSSTVSDLIFQNENLKFQLSEKNTLISSLYTDIQKFEGELKALEKPRNLQKKYTNIINDLNNQIINQKARDLSFKYMKITK